jgi:hypothetical protein
VSYEGRYQVTCENGHYHEWDAYSFCYNTSKCDECGAKFKEVNSVDDTNCPSEGYDYTMEARAEKLRKDSRTRDGCKILYSFWV